MTPEEKRQERLLVAALCLPNPLAWNMRDDHGKSEANEYFMASAETAVAQADALIAEVDKK